MSRENVEVLLAIFLGSFYPAFYQLLAATAENFAWDTTTFEGWPEPREFHGFQGFIEIPDRVDHEPV